MEKKKKMKKREGEERDENEEKYEVKTEEEDVWYHRIFRICRLHTGPVSTNISSTSVDIFSGSTLHNQPS